MSFISSQYMCFFFWKFPQLGTLNVLFGEKKINRRLFFNEAQTIFFTYGFVFHSPLPEGEYPVV